MSGLADEAVHRRVHQGDRAADGSHRGCLSRTNSGAHEVHEFPYLQVASGATDHSRRERRMAYRIVGNSGEATAEAPALAAGWSGEAYVSERRRTRPDRGRPDFGQSEAGN